MSRGQAATWVAQQVSHSDIVSCDPVMCTALAAAGFPAANLRALGPTSPYPVTSAVVVVTPVVNEIFGSSLSVDWAPMVLATFGSGTAQVAVRVIGPHGAAAYRAAVSADLVAREIAAAALLEVPGSMPRLPPGRNLLVGQVDSRLLLAIAYVAGDQPIDMVDFGNIAPGQDPGVPLRYADLAENDQAAGQVSAAYVRSLIADFRNVNTQSARRARRLRYSQAARPSSGWNFRAEPPRAARLAARAMPRLRVPGVGLDRIRPGEAPAKSGKYQKIALCTLSLSMGNIGGGTTRTNW